MPEFSEVLAFIKAVVWKHWLPIVTSIGVPPILEQGYKWIFKKDLPVRLHFGWIIGAGAIVAVFLAWNDEYTSRLALEKDQVLLIGMKASISDQEKQLVSLRGQLPEKSEQIRDLKQDVSDLKRDKAELQEKMEASAEQQQIVIAGKQAVIKDLQATLGDRRRRQDIYKELGVFLDQGEAWKIRVMREKETKPPIEEIAEWGDGVHFFLMRHVGPAQAALFRSPPSTPDIPHNIPYPHNATWNVIERRLAVLRSFINSSEFGIPIKEKK